MNQSQIAFAIGTCLGIFVLRTRGSKNKPLKATSPTNQQSLVDAFIKTSPTEWTYIAEGALNLALKYTGSNAILKGYVLRVRKDNPDATGGKVCPPNPWGECLTFVDKLVVPILGRRYVQASIEVPLATDFIKLLGIHIENDRPVKRRIHKLEKNLRVGLLMIDNTCIPTTKTHDAICFELKCKWGFMPDSPWITKSIKRQVDRFTMHQKYKYSKGKLDTLSKYCPLDLFSSDKTRIAKALDNLVATPQNNFRLFVNGKMAFPDSKGHGNKEQLEEIVRKLPGIDGGADEILNVLARIVEQEPLFERIKQMQQLDDLDVEAIWPMYQSVVSSGGEIPPLVKGETIKPRKRPLKLPETKQDKIDSIQRFLLSCTAKDCSIMIVIQPSENKNAKQDRIHRYMPVETEGKRTIVKNCNGYSYSIAIVDLDPKPIEKMKHWFELDGKIADFYSANM